MYTRLKRIEVTGFKSIRSLGLELSDLNMLIGANGSGKSNFVSLFELLNEIAGQHLQLFVSRKGYANSFLYFGQKVTDQITIKLEIPPNVYHCTLVPTVDDDLIFADETCLFYGSPDYQRPYSVSLGSGHKETRLIKAAQDSSTNNVASYVLKKLQSWRVYHFHDTSDSSPVKKKGNINDYSYLRPDASNLAAFLYRLMKTSSAYYEAIRDTIRLVAPFFDDFILRPQPENENKIWLEWRARGSDYPFLPHHLSDGTLRFICLTTLLLQPELPSTILIDEPELGLHPYAINTLGAMMRSASERSQLIVSTQSVSLVNQFDPEDLLIVELHDQATVISRVNPLKLSEWLDEYSLGELWEKNILGGRPSR